MTTVYQHLKLLRNKMKKITLLSFILFSAISYAQSIELNGTISAQGNQIKNVQDPTEAQDAVTKAYIDGLIANLQSQIDDLGSGNSSTVTDQDGNTYDYLVYCDKFWMTENLVVKSFRNGDPIPEVQNPSDWENLTTPAWCYYNGDPSNEEEYGILYNWYAVNDPRGLAPTGWHLPEIDEVNSLISCLGGNNVAGGKMKTIGTIENGDGTWLSPNLNATNDSGWNGNGAGAIALNSATPPQAVFFNLGHYESYWSSTISENSPNLVYHYNINSYSSNCNVSLQNGPVQGSPGFSVRCVKD